MTTQVYKCNRSSCLRHHVKYANLISLNEIQSVAKNTLAEGADPVMLRL